mgnify:CR=1 FL=1
MYESIKNLIESGNYELVDILKKINTVWLKSYITEEEMEELEALAREKANPVNSYAPLQEQIDNIYTELDKIKADINSLKNQEVQATEEPQEPAEPVEEYPPYKQPTGAHDAYKTGDKITYNDKKYVCKLDGCVWTPDAYPAGWEEVVEETTESEG